MKNKFIALFVTALFAIVCTASIAIGSAHGLMAGATAFILGDAAVASVGLHLFGLRLSECRLFNPTLITSILTLCLDSKTGGSRIADPNRLKTSRLGYWQLTRTVLVPEFFRAGWRLSASRE